MTGKVGIVTGASGGIASGIVRHLTAQGWRLILVSRSGCTDIAADTGQTGLAGSVLSDGDMAAASGPPRVTRPRGAAGPRDQAKRSKLSVARKSITRSFAR